MRRIIVATLTAVLVVIGLSAVLLGTASASTPLKTAEGDSCTLSVGVTGVIKAGVCVAVEVTSPTTTPTAPPTARHCARNEHWDNRLDRCVRDGVGSGPIYGGGPVYRDCNDARSHGLRDIRRGTQYWNDSWDRNRDGIACDDGDVVAVSSDGQCVTFRDQNRDFGTRYNTGYNLRLDQARSINSDGGRLITPRERRDIEDAADLRDFRNRWTSSRDSLRTICNDPTPEVQIITVPTPAPVTVTAAPPPPPAPVTSSGGGSLPSGHYNGGGWSTAFTLAHARVQ